MFGFFISTHDYRIYCGDAPPSPIDKERKISRTNEEKKIEKLSKPYSYKKNGEMKLPKIPKLPNFNSENKH